MLLVPLLARAIDYPHVIPRMYQPPRSTPSDVARLQQAEYPKDHPFLVATLPQKSGIILIMGEIGTRITLWRIQRRSDERKKQGAVLATTHLRDCRSSS